jgi:putative membrane protein insertion efficiency factor
MKALGRLAARVVMAYQRLLSPFLGRQCRFAPTCSEYARLVLIEHGLLRGGWLATWRLLKCHPLHPGGNDPPPPGRMRSREDADVGEQV